MLWRVEIPRYIFASSVLRENVGATDDLDAAEHIEDGVIDKGWEPAICRSAARTLVVGACSFGGRRKNHPADDLLSLRDLLCSL